MREEGLLVTKEELLQAISNMTVLELVGLVKALEEKFGVSAAVSIVPTFWDDEAPIVDQEEQVQFDVILTAVGDQKIQVIKAVRELTSLGLREAKAVVDQAPSKMLEAVSKEAAMAAKERLTSAGATVEIR